MNELVKGWSSMVPLTLTQSAGGEDVGGAFHDDVGPPAFARLLPECRGECEIEWACDRSRSDPETDHGISLI
jgi:hypothetical protein